uniref:DNA2/NAM7 helicase-like C-terminal domain-containing protein n=1 Tax=Ditylenchus dipsaci TaxID=166011 RepID=A0A915CZ65_9BILA
MLNVTYQACTELVEFPFKLYFNEPIQSIKELTRSHDLPEPFDSSRLWLIVSSSDSHRAESQPTTFINTTEAAEICSFVEYLRPGGNDLSNLVVICAYGSQHRVLYRQFAMKNICVPCHTVDSFMGQESDIVVISLSRTSRTTKGFYETNL